MMEHREGGFTLIETITVLVILSIMAVVSFPTMTGFIEDAKEKRYISEAQTVSAGVQSYLMQEYAKGDFNTFEFHTSVSGSPLGSEQNIMTDILEGCYTSGALINGMGFQEDTMEFQYFYYQLDSYIIEIYYNTGEVKIIKTSPRETKMRQEV